MNTAPEGAFTMFKLIDHTADIGIEVEAESIEELFRESARGMFSIICENLQEVECTREIEGKVEGEDIQELMYNFLEDLLFLFEVKRLLVKDVDVRIGDNHLEYRACGETVNPEKHVIATGIKSPTYHMMEIKRKNGGWWARIIFDV